MNIANIVRNSRLYKVFKNSRYYLIWKWIRKYWENNARHGNFSLNTNSKNYWDEKLDQMGESWRDENYHHLIEFLPKNRSFSLLDIGCALGDGCEYIIKHRPNAEVTGVDISKVGIRKAIKKSDKRGSELDYMVLDVLDDDIPGLYDYIVIVETLEHFDNPFRVVDKCLSHTKEALIISVPYTPDRSGPVQSLGEHRYEFNEETFSNYKHLHPPKITDYVEVTKSQCIVYVLKP